MIKVKQSGSFAKTEAFLKQGKNINYKSILKHYGQRGVDLLREATPVDTGETANSWSYKINETKDGYTLEWHNSKIAGNIPVVMLLVYGHGCQNGSYVEGNNFVTPALRHMFKKMARELLKEVE